MVSIRRSDRSHNATALGRLDGSHPCHILFILQCNATNLSAIMGSSLLLVTVPAVSAAGDDDELDDQKAAAVETAVAAPDTVADFDLAAYHALLARDDAPTVRGCMFGSACACHWLRARRRASLQACQSHTWHW